MTILTVAQVLDANDLGLAAGFTDLLDAVVGGRRVLYALNGAEGKLVELSVATDGALTVESTLVLAGRFAIGSESNLTLVDASGSPALAISGLDPDAGSLVTLTSSGGLVQQTTAPVLGLLAAATEIALDDGVGLLTGRPGGGIDLYRDTGVSYSFLNGLSDGPGLYLADVLGGIVTVDASETLFAVASATESGVSILRIAPNGSVSLASSFGVAEGLPISTPSDLVALGDHLVLGASGSSSLTVLRVDEEGELWLEDHVLDNQVTRFQSVTTMGSATVGDYAFVAAGGADGGVSLFTMLPTGRLIHLASAVDTAATTLFRASSISLSSTPSFLNVSVASQWEVGITRLSWDISGLGAVLVLDQGASGTGGSGNDQIIGTDVADTLNGAGGDDILFDGAGTDLLIGGGGTDLFVFASDGLPDRIADYEAGIDRLDLSAFDFLYGVEQLMVTPTTDGAQLAFRDEVIDIVSADGTPLSAANFDNDSILNVDRPPVLKVNQSLEGGPLADILNGGAGDDTILGADGDDWLSGAAGQDSLVGGNGQDSLDGGDGADTLSGEGGADTIAGGSGDDLIDGGAGGDVLYGDDFDWIDPA